MTFQWKLPTLTPPRKRLQPYEWDAFLGPAGGLTFGEIADETGLSHAEIREIVEVLVEVGFIRPGRGWYRNRITDLGRWAVREGRARRERRRQGTQETCPRCGKTGWHGCPDPACFLDAIQEQVEERLHTRLPPAGSSLSQLTLFETER